MNFWSKETKIFAVIFLFFVNFSVVGAQSSIYELPAGTKMLLRMDNEINSQVSSANDTFTATLDKAVTINGSIVLPTGTIIEGRIINVERAASGGKAGKMTVKFEMLRFTEGTKRRIEADLSTPLKAAKPTTFNILSIVGGTGIGAIIGAVFKGGSGAAIGGAVGAGIGTGVALVKKGREVRIKTDEKFEIELKKSVNLPVQDY